MFKTLLIFIFLSYLSLANESAPYINKAFEKNLSQDPYWLKLLYFKGDKSDVLNEGFFTSKEGRESAKKELEASIRAVFKFSKNSNEHIKCKFPARYKWLKKKLNIKSKKAESLKCPNLEKWTLGNSIDSVSLVFATGYTGNPASYFGHPLVLFNYKREIKKSKLLDMAINYGAFTANEPNPVLYILKGVFGGFNAGYSTSYMSHTLHSYGERELRDLWQYNLKLNKDQLELLVDHTWELFNARFPYYFTADNCAYRLAELFNFVLDVELLPKGVPYAIPHTLFDRINEYGLVSQVEYTPSRESRLKDAYKQLSSEEQELMKSYIDGDVDIRVIAKNRTLLEALIDYYSYLRLKHDQNFPSKRRELLLARSKLAIKKEQNIQAPMAPHRWQKPVKTTLSFNDSKELGNFYSLRFRPSYYDVLTARRGGGLKGVLGVFDLSIAFKKDQVWLNHLKLFNLRSYALNETGLSGLSALSWQLDIGINNEYYSCVTCQNIGVEGGFGKSYALHDTLMMAFMLNSRVHKKVRNSGVIYSEPEALIVWDPLKSVSFSATYKKRIYIDKNLKKDIFESEMRLLDSRKWDLRVKYLKFYDQKYSLSISKYW